MLTGTTAFQASGVLSVVDSLHMVSLWDVNTQVRWLCASRLGFAGVSLTRAQLNPVQLRHPQGVHCAVWSTAGQLLATASQDKLLRIFDVRATAEPTLVRAVCPMSRF